MIPSALSKLSSWKAWAAASLLLVGCSGGENKPILVGRITASLMQDLSLLPAEPVAFFDNIQTFQDTITLDIVIRDNTNVLETDEVSLVLWYDATFIQILSVSSVSTDADPNLFGNSCGTIDAACSIASPICLSNRSAANRGGAAFCRGDSDTACVTDADCSGVDPVCGSFGTLEASFVVVTSNEVCENDPTKACTTDSECLVCSNDPTRSCLGPLDCRLCSQDASQTCTMDADCGLGNTCQTGTCDGNCLATGCGTVICSTDADCGAGNVCQAPFCLGTVRIASLAFRVTDAGLGEIRFKVSSNPGAVGSLLREKGGTLGVQFYPSIDFTDPANPSTAGRGEITVMGTL